MSFSQCSVVQVSVLHLILQKEKGKKTAADAIGEHSMLFIFLSYAAAHDVRINLVF